jgi:hypothetical protein
MSTSMSTRWWGRTARWSPVNAVVALTCPRPAGAVVDIAAAVADVSRPAMAALLTGVPPR